MSWMPYVNVPVAHTQTRPTARSALRLVLAHTRCTCCVRTVVHAVRMPSCTWQVPVPPPGFTFPCSAGVVERLGRSATCRYQINGLGARHKAEITWQVAEERCRDMELFGAGARLAEPRTAEQVQYLASTLRAHGAESLWIGLRRVSSSHSLMGTDSNSNFKWESGAALTSDEARWAATEPNGAKGDCVEMWEDGTWNDRACDIGKVLACERVVH